MRKMRILRDRLRALWHPERVHDDIADEFRFHMEMRARENERGGMTTADAQRDAKQRFGSSAPATATNLELGLVLHAGKKTPLYRVFFENRFKE